MCITVLYRYIRKSFLLNFVSSSKHWFLIPMWWKSLKLKRTVAKYIFFSVRFHFLVALTIYIASIWYFSADTNWIDMLLFSRSNGPTLVLKFVKIAQYVVVCNLWSKPKCVCAKTTYIENQNNYIIISLH